MQIEQKCFESFDLQPAWIFSILTNLIRSFFYHSISRVILHLLEFIIFDFCSSKFDCTVFNGAIKAEYRDFPTLNWPFEVAVEGIC